MHPRSNLILFNSVFMQNQYNTSHVTVLVIDEEKAKQSTFVMTLPSFLLLFCTLAVSQAVTGAHFQLA